MDTEELHTINELESLSDMDIISLLKRHWLISDDKDINVWGNLSKVTIRDGGVIYKIGNVKTANKNTPIEYPPSDLNERESIHNMGVYVDRNAIPNEIDFSENEIFVSCVLIISALKFRKKRSNPMLVQVKSGSLKLLRKIEKHAETDVIDSSKYLYVEENVVRFEIQKNKKRLKEEIEEDNKRQKVLKDEFKSEIQALEKFKEDKFDQIEELDDDAMKKELLSKKLSEEISGFESERIVITNKIEMLRRKYKGEFEIMTNKLEKFKIFVKDKADTLLSLEFIDQEEYDGLLGVNSENDDSQMGRLDFEEDLKSNFSTAVAHIQAYLFNKDIMYPKYIIEDFFALIQTNDLIILAGESGSGKTNLVKSFADAVGGICKVIPVKPNWTSSEDLLGYYNPLEKNIYQHHF